MRRGTFSISRAVMNKALAIANLDGVLKTTEVILADMFIKGGSILGDKIEAQTANRLYRSYLKRAEEAYKEAVKKFEQGEGKPTREEVRKIAREVARKIADVPDDDIEFLTQKTAEMYALAGVRRQEKIKELARKELRKVKKAAPTPQGFPSLFGYTFDMADSEAIEAMSSNQVYWIGDQYGKKVQEGITSKAETEIFEKGLGRKEASSSFRQVLNQEMGLTVPAQYRGSAQSYFAGIAGLVRVQSNAFASVKAFKNSGVTKYEVVAVGDERMCPECGFMDGTVFDTSQGVGHITRIGKAKTPEQVKNVNAWMKRPAMMQRAGVKTPGGFKTVHGRRNMAKAGLALPPYHFRCRCVVEPYEFDPNVYESGTEAPLDVGFPYDESRMKSVPMRLDGMHAKSVYEAPDGTRWLFKPQPKWQSEVDVATAKIARKLGIEAPDVYSLKFKGQTGSIQRMYDDVEGSIRTLGRTKLTKEQAEAVQREHILDWLISNHDSHDGNLLLISKGQIRGIDKGQSFKFFGRDKLWIDYNPNPSPSYYNTMFRRYMDGDNIPIAPLKSKNIEAVFKAVDEMTDEEFISILKPYIEGAKKAGTLSTKDEEAFVKLALSRKKNLRTDFDEFYKRVEAERLKNAKVVAPEPENVGLTRKDSIQDIDAKFIKAVDDEAASLGRMFYVAGDDFEDMGVLAYKVGDDLVLEAKLREKAGLALAKNLDEVAVSTVTQAPIQDEAWNSVLSAIKSINHHYGPGGDQVFKAQYILNATKAIDTLTDPLAKKYYTKILDSLYDVSKQKPGPGLGKQFKPYTPKAKPKDVRAPKGKGYTVEKRNVTDTEKAYDFDEGKIKGSVDKTGAVHSGRIQYSVKFDDGTRIDFITQGDNNLTSKVGRVQIYPGRNTAASYKKALAHLDDLGLNSKLATKVDAELMYLQKAAYTARIHNKAPFKSLITGQKKLSPEDRIAKLKEAWEKHLGRKLTKETGYDPRPFYLHSQNRGVARWRRFDWTDDDLRDFRLSHQITGVGGTSEDYLTAIERMARSGGALATEDRYRQGISTLRGTMSPGRDQETGGASYFFTRLFSKGQTDRFKPDLVFSNEALKDMNTISYKGDLYGNVKKMGQRAKTKTELSEFTARGANETIVRHSVGFEHLEKINVRTPDLVDPVKEIMKKYGFGHVEVEAR